MNRIYLGFLVLLSVSSHAYAYKFNPQTSTRERLQIEGYCEEYTLDVMYLYKSLLDGKSDDDRYDLMVDMQRKGILRSREDVDSLNALVSKIYQRDKKIMQKSKKHKDLYSSTYWEVNDMCMKNLEASLYY